MPGGVAGPAAGGRVGVNRKVEALGRLSTPTARRRVSSRIEAR
jgi:hypothetical protein